MTAHRIIVLSVINDGDPAVMVADPIGSCPASIAPGLSPASMFASLITLRPNSDDDIALSALIGINAHPTIATVRVGHRLTKTDAFKPCFFQNSGDKIRLVPSPIAPVEATINFRFPWRFLCLMPNLPARIPCL